MRTSFWAVLAGALITGVVTIAVWLANNRAEKRRGAQTAREHAYADLVASTIRVADRHSAALLTVRARSGLDEGIALLLRLRTPLVPMDLHDWIAPDVNAMWEAWVRVQTHGTTDGIALANEVLNAQARLSTTLTVAKPHGTLDRLGSTLRPIDITAAQTQFDAARSALFRDLRALLALSRHESGRQPSAELLLPEPPSAATP